MRRDRQAGPARGQGGAAILMAMLTVVLVATLAASALWQQWRGVEIEAAQRSRVQAAWVLTGALDWARLSLREDARKSGPDHLAEPWAVPLEQARLSTFLATDRSDALAADAAEAAFLSGRITDLQSQLNVSNLVLDGKVHAPSVLAFARLFDLLGLPKAELAALAANARLAQGELAAAPAQGASAPQAPVIIATAPLWPQDLNQLAWLGLSPRSIATPTPIPTGGSPLLTRSPTRAVNLAPTSWSRRDAVGGVVIAATLSVDRKCARACQPVKYPITSATRSIEPELSASIIRKHRA